jgi:hypothetical protein
VVCREREEGDAVGAVPNVDEEDCEGRPEGGAG